MAYAFPSAELFTSWAGVGPPGRRLLSRPPVTRLRSGALAITSRRSRLHPANPLQISPLQISKVIGNALPETRFIRAVPHIRTESCGSLCGRALSPDSPHFVVDHCLSIRQ